MKRVFLILCLTAITTLPLRNASITKTQGTALLALQSVASNTVVISSAQDVSTKLAATVFIHFGRRATTALTEGCDFRIEASSKSTLDGHWYPLTSFKTETAASESEALTANEAAGATVLEVASTTNLAVGDIIYIDNTTIANAEFHRVTAVNLNVSITIEDPLVNGQNVMTLFDRAEMYVASLDLTAVGRLRLVANCSNTGQAVAVESHMVTGDSIQ